MGVKPGKPLKWKRPPLTTADAGEGADAEEDEDEDEEGAGGSGSRVGGPAV